VRYRQSGPPRTTTRWPGAVDAVYYAALIYGDEYGGLLAAAAARLAQLSGSG
jgi:hypothetical protein